EVTISVPLGVSLAGRTLNSRLGIVGGISILGTSGIVRPLSAEAWTATIAASMSVAHAMGKDAENCHGDTPDPCEPRGDRPGKSGGIPRGPGFSQPQRQGVYYDAGD